MDIRQLTPHLAVSPQISPDEIPQIKAAGFTTVICNRPDSEVPPALQSAEMAAAVEAAGLTFVVNPAVHTAMTPELIARQKAAIAEAEGPVLAYCQSGTRSTVIWMLGEAETTAPDTLIETAAQAGYQLAALQPQLEALHKGS